MSHDTITAFDAFCGAGGSSTGLVAAGIEVRLAANHNQLALDTHATNHPNTQHDRCDLMAAHPSQFPHTTIAWFSPMCTKHAGASGRKVVARNQLNLWGEPDRQTPEEVRSRASMHEVVEFTEYHRYEIVMVENVVEVRQWEYYDDWLKAMINLGYDYKTVYLNAQFFDVPQSRDRWYTIFWKKGNKAPDLDFCPIGTCKEHGAVRSMQVFKKTDFTWGRYKRQYAYHCPICGGDVEHTFLPAASVIDWNAPITKIKDRKTPLNEKTMQRILAGIKKFSGQPAVMDLAYGSGDRNYPIQSPLPTQTTRQTLMLTQPFISEMYGNIGNRATSDPLGAITTTTHHLLVQPPFISSYYGGRNAVSLASDPLPTITTFNNQHWLIEPEEMIDEVGARMLSPNELKLGMSFPTDYIILGNKRDQTIQVGNAVAPKVSEYLARQCMASLQ